MNQAQTRGLLAGLLLGVFTVAFQLVGVVAALPEIMAQLDAMPLYPWAFTTMVIGMLAATLTAGQLCDRRGPLRPMAVGLVMMILGLVVGSLASHVYVLLAARLLQGIGAGALNVTFFVVIALSFPASRRPGVLALFSFCWLLPAFLGPPAAAALVAFSWRLVFAATIPLLVIAAVLLAPHIRAIQRDYAPDRGTVGMSPWAVLAVALGPALLQLAGQVAGGWAICSALLGILVLGLGMRRALPGRVLNLNPGLGPIVATRALQAGSFLAGEAYLLLGLQHQRGLSTFQAGLALTIGSVGWSFGSWLQSRAWIRWRRDQLITLGASCVAICMLLLGAVLTAPQLPLWLGAVAWIVGGVGMGLTTASTAVATMALSAVREQGRNASALQVSEAIGNSVLAALTGAAYALLIQRGIPSLGLIFALLLVASLLAVVLSLRIGPVHDTQVAD